MLSPPIQARQTPYAYRNSARRMDAPLRVGSKVTPTAYVSSPYQDTPIQDRFLDPKHNLSSQQALGLFLGGFTLGLAGKSLWRFLRPSVKNTEPADFSILPETVKPNNIAGIPQTTEEIGCKTTVYQNYNDPLSSMYRIVHLDPNQGNALLVYAATSVLGYLSGSVVQGSKETWVRREETRIRANLVNRLQGVVRQSIQNKNQFNSALKEDLRTRLITLLQKYKIPNATDLVQDVPIVESLQIQRDYFYQPTHRTTTLFKGKPTEAWQSGSLSNEPSTLLTMQKAMLFGAGVFSGAVLHGFVKLLQAKDHVDITKSNKSVYESVQLKDLETWSLIGSKNAKNFAIMGGFFAMSAAAHIGKTLLDGLREVEVTRQNARTEWRYQTHNWLTQDPAFHEIAEREAANHAFSMLEQDLPRLKYNSTLLQQRVQAILSNVGRNSAPPYFPMTPMVNLVEARA